MKHIKKIKKENSVKINKEAKENSQASVLIKESEVKSATGCPPELL